MVKLRSSSLLFASSVVLLTGCHTKPKDGVAAIVNGHPIQTTEVDKVYAAQLATNPQQQSQSSEQAMALKLNILHTLIAEETIEQRAAKQNLTATDADVDAKLVEMKAPYTEEQFNSRLKASNLTLDELKRDIRRSLTQNKLLNKEINSRITVTDADVAAYYTAHKAEFNLPENQYHLAAIQVSSQGSAPTNNLQSNKANGDEDAHKKIQALKNRIDAGDDFGTLAANFSERQDTAPNGGDMGFITESQMAQMKLADAATFNAIMALKAGQTTDIVPIVDPAAHRTLGYAIYKLISKDAAGQRDVNDPSVQQAIRQQLHDSRSQLLKTAYYEMLRDQVKVENFLAEQVFKDTAK